MTDAEAIAQLSQLNRGGYNPYSDAERALIAQLYAEIFKRPLRTCNCPDKWHDAVVEALHYLKRRKSMKTKSKYRLRAGVVLQIAGSTEIYTNDNLTDEVAAAFLAKNPKAAGRFEYIPDEPEQPAEPAAVTDATEIADEQHDGTEPAAEVEPEATEADENATAEPDEPEQPAEPAAAARRTRK